MRKGKISVGLLVLVTSLLMVSSCVGSMNLIADANSTEIINQTAPVSGVLDAQAQPYEAAAGPGQPSPKVWVDDEFIISYDDSGFQDAMNPSVAVSPFISPFPNSIHAAWNEYDETMGVQTIHYSMSESGEKGLEWSNDEEAEGDRTIGNYTKNATNPSIAIDNSGVIHLVWCQEYMEDLKAEVITYEVHYSQSTDNGQTWSLEIPVSFRKNGGYDTPNEFFPKIAVSNDYMGLTILHAVWSEFDPESGTQEVYYSRHDGSFWSGIETDMPISSPASLDPAGNPDVASGGFGAEYVHVVWTQYNLTSETNETFYTRSTDAGAGSIWDIEKTISAATIDGFPVGKAKVAAFGDNVYTIWDQPLGITNGYSEICLSMSDAAGATGWSGTDMNIPISFHDGDWGADFGSLDVLTAPNGAAYAVWTEYDETSPYGSSEIHYSMSLTPDDPLSWTGTQEDIVLSSPDGETGEPANAAAPAMDLANFDGEWKPQIVWSELNSQGGGAKADNNNEIHYIPDTTFEVPITHLGWNLISVPLIQNDTSILTVLSDSEGDGNTTWDMVWAYDNSGSTPTWPSYATFKPDSINTLLNIDHKMGFWINITNLGDGNLTVSGDYGTSTNISLYAGWNLVGYPAQTSKSVTDSFASLGATRDKAVEGYSAASPYKIAQLAGTDMMQSGEAYWVHVTADIVWTVDW